jgi:hypothetical protein
VTKTCKIASNDGCIQHANTRRIARYTKSLALLVAQLAYEPEGDPEPANRFERLGTGNSEMELKRNGTQPSGKGPDDYFTGNVRIDPLFNAPFLHDRDTVCECQRLCLIVGDVDGGDVQQTL